MKWIDFTDADALKPMPGQRCLISFTAAPDRVIACYYDNKESFEAREQDAHPIFERDLPDDYKPGWFTDAHDRDDWWEAQYIGHWLPLVLPSLEVS